MRWPVVAIVVYLVLGLEQAVKPALMISPEGFQIAPTFVVPFLVFVALSGPVVPVLWLSLIMGVIVDLSSVRSHGVGGMGGAGGGLVCVAGPYALGYVAASYLVIVMRGMMFRRGQLAMVFLSVLAAVVAELVVVALFSVRSIYTDPSMWSGGRELVNRVLSAGYTAMTAGALALLLFPIAPLFGFQETHSRRFSGRKHGDGRTVRGR